jgi:hypothetical protein
LKKTEEELEKREDMASVATWKIPTVFWVLVDSFVLNTLEIRDTKLIAFRVCQAFIEWMLSLLATRCSLCLTKNGIFHDREEVVVGIKVLSWFVLIIS